MVVEKMLKNRNSVIKKTKLYLVSAVILLLGVTAAVAGEVVLSFKSFYYASDLVYFARDLLFPLLLIFLSTWLYEAKIISNKMKIVFAVILIYLSVSSLRFGLRGMWSTLTSEYFSYRAVLVILMTIITSTIMFLLILLIVDNQKQTGTVIIVGSVLLIPIHCFYAAEELHSLINHLYPNITSWGFFLSEVSSVLICSAIIVFVHAYIHNECQDID